MKGQTQLKYLGGSLHEVKDKNILIIISEIKNFDFYKYLSIIISELISQNNTINFLELTSKELSHNFLPRRFEISRFKRHKKLCGVYKQTFFDYLIEKKIPFKKYNLKIAGSAKTQRRYTRISDLISEGLDPSCLRSILSIHGTHITRTIEKTSKLNKHESRQINHMKNTFNQITEKVDLDLIDVHDILLVLNGRMPDQAAFSKIAEFTNKDIYYFEHGGKLKESFHFEKFMPQNTISMQTNFLIRQQFNLEQLAQHALPFVEKWLLEQRNALKTNHLENSAGKIGEFYKKNQGKIALICTSSLSEHDFYSGSNSNSLQSEVIPLAARKLKSEGFDVVVRIHPNEIKNNWNDIFILLKSLSEIEVKLVYPWDTISTYSLVEISEIVVVWDSTIGLECYFRGKPIFILNDSFYSAILGINKITKDDLMDSGTIFKAEKGKMNLAILAAYLRIANGYSIKDSPSKNQILFDLNNKYEDQITNIAKIHDEFADSIMEKIAGRVCDLMELRFPIRIKRRFAKVCGEKLSNFVMQIIVFAHRTKRNYA